MSDPLTETYAELLGKHRPWPRYAPREGFSREDWPGWTGYYCPCGWEFDGRDGAAKAARAHVAAVLVAATNADKDAAVEAVEVWPYTAEDAARSIAAMSWPMEREENRDSWAVKMLADPVLCAVESNRAQDRLTAAIASVTAALAVRAAAQPVTEDECECVGFTIRTDYGTGIEHDVDRSSCPIHGAQPVTEEAGS